MQLRFLTFAFAGISLVLGVSLNPKPEASSSEAVEKALPLLQRSAKVWFQKTKCDSCHHQALGQVTVALAKERGFRIDRQKSDEQNRLIREQSELSRFKQFESTGAINGSAGFSFLLFGQAAAGAPKSDETDATVYYLLGKQAIDGRWPSFSRRPPLEDTPVTLTAMAIRGVRLYAPDHLRKDAQRAIDKGHRWLTGVRAKSTEEAIFQLLGIFWSGRDQKLLPRLRAELLNQQRPDGGWAQIATADSDAYATGQVLVALNVVGIPTGHPAYRKGVQFLVDSQKADGSWLVKTRRRFPGLPYFETGFPHREHQFISFAGTAWASMALSLASKPETSQALTTVHVPSRRSRPAPLSPNPKDNRLLTAALQGTVEEMRKAVQAGANVDARSTGGGTVLMYAVRNPRKVKFLLEKGANPNIVSNTKTTALMLAAEYVGNDESMHLLLRAGADPNAARDEYEDVLALAASTGDTKRVKALLAAGVKQESVMLGAAMACYGIDLVMLKVFLDAGVDPNAKFGDNQDTLLTVAAVDGLAEMVRVLLDRGADPNHVTQDGLSTLMLAAMCDHGGTETVELLLAKGAKPDFRTPEGKTALSLAEKYGNDEIARVIRSRSSR